MAKQFRGVYAIPPTPFTEGDRIDAESLRQIVDFCVTSGVHGIVAPVNASEGPFLTDEERRTVVEIIVEQTNGRVPVVAGVSSVSTRATLEHARHAESAGADALMAMPPYVRHPTADEIPAFYTALASESRLPIFIQNYVVPVGTPMSASLVARLMRELDNVSYLKEETAQAPQLMTQIKALAGQAMLGMMGGMAGRYLLDEYARGACGTMPACEVADAHVSVWNALEAGDEKLARERFRLLLPLLNYESMFGIVVYKEVLRRRGIIANARVRAPGSPSLDEHNHRELDAILRDLAPLLALGARTG
ncbi:MAG TPA: dihydrodipicolinate synthase family protein [Chloroflexota bacterium]|nr:dihydrodipicolinate synthase family protein [Chloroflexota bacterium]